MAGLKIISHKTVELKEGSEALVDVLKKISNAASVPDGKIVEARLHFENPQGRNPCNGTPTLTVSFVESVSLEQSKAALDAGTLAGIFDIEVGP